MVAAGHPTDPRRTAPDWIDLVLRADAQWFRPPHRLLLFYIAGEADADGRALLMVSQLAWATRQSSATTRAQLRRLREAGMVEVTPLPGIANHYRLVPEVLARSQRSRDLGPAVVMQTEPPPDVA